MIPPEGYATIPGEGFQLTYVERRIAVGQDAYVFRLGKTGGIRYGKPDGIEISLPVTANGRDGSGSHRGGIHGIFVHMVVVMEAGLPLVTQFRRAVFL